MCGESDMKESDSSQGTVTVRIIKSFPYKNFKCLVFPNLDLSKHNLQTLYTLIQNKINATPALAQYAKCLFNTFKLYYHAHGAKTNNPMINLGSDELLILKDWDKCLWDLGIRHETEVSLFDREPYEAYKIDGSLKWE